MKSRNQTILVLLGTCLLGLATACGQNGHTIDLHPESSNPNESTASFHPVQIGSPAGTSIPSPSPTPLAQLPGDAPKQDAPVTEPTPGPTPQAIAATFHFDFASSTLGEDEIRKIDALLKSLAGYSKITSISIVGVSDPIGNPQNNARLAQSRAEAVRDALVARSAQLFQMPLNKDLIVISALVANDWSCTQETSRADRIDCFQNDRRSDVIIEVVGAASVSQP